MPTGFTAIIDDNENVTLADYVWQCARAFGALVTLRDEPMGAPIPEFKPSEFYEERVRRAETELVKVRALTVEQAQAAMDDEYSRESEQRIKWRLEEETKIARYDAMRVQVEAWQPPTPEHSELKSFMLQQLSVGAPSVGWCKPPEPSTETPERWLASSIEKAEDGLRRAQQALEDERRRCAERNRWVKALSASVPMPASE